MRVWALASCSGLLALAACSAEQSSSPNPSAVPLDGEDAADIKTQPGLTAAASSPMARPEIRPRQVIQGGYRLNLSPGKLATAESSGQTLPQAAELRQRLERLRNQQGSRLSPSTPLVTAPQPATLARPNLSQPSLVKPAVEQEIVAFDPVQNPTFSPQGFAALPTPPRPNPVAPEANSPTVGATTNLGEVASASVARPYPVAPLQHQGYSAQSQRPAPVLAAESSTTARLHGGTLTAQQTESVIPEGANSSQAAIVEGSTSPEPNSSSNSSRTSAAAIDASTPDLAVRSESSAPVPLTAGSHQSSGAVALTPTSPPLNSLETRREAHQSQGVSAEGQTAPVGQAPVLWESARAEAANRAATGFGIAPPESLPLNLPSAQPNLVRPQSAESASDPDSSTAGVNLPETAAIPEQTLVSSRFPNAARIAAPALQPALPSPERLQPETAALREASAAPELHHRSQVDPETVRLIPTASNIPKGLPVAYCLSPSGQLVPTTLETEGSSASLPRFSSSSFADPSFGRDADLSKDNPAELCVGMPSTSPELATTPALD